MRRRMPVAALCAALALMPALLGCGSTQQPGLPGQSEPSGSPQAGLSRPPAAPKQTTPVEFSHLYARIELALPEGWEYSANEYSPDAYSCGVSFWPAGQTSGKLDLRCYTSGFGGVCGTGLKSEPIVFDSGLTGSMGAYGNGEVWDFIFFDNTPGAYAVWNSGADVWWEQYGAEAMEIIGGVRLGGDSLREDEAVELAKAECTVRYDRALPAFDLETGEWEIDFRHGSEVKQTVRLDAQGAVILPS